MTAPPSHRSARHGIEARIEALSDGVFAIAMTLLVLGIKVPELPREVAPAELWHATIEHSPIFFSWRPGAARLPAHCAPLKS